MPSSQAFIAKAFSEYYHQSQVQTPSSMEKREFAFLTLGDKMMLRHKHFAATEFFQKFLASLVPSDVYCSCAYYDDPEAEMDKKGWEGADLVFDIDADHIPTTCGKVHDEWTCGGCGFAGKGLTPGKCPVCGGEKFDVKTWPCNECLRSAKDETIKLLDMLLNDFGFSESETHVFFSGHRGYHVHVESEIVKTIDSNARKEIADYACGLGLDSGFLGFDEKRIRGTHVPKRLKLGESGWRGRISKNMYDFIRNAKREDYRSLGLNRGVIETIVGNRDVILKSWDDKGPYRAAKGIGLETWRRIFGHSMFSASAKIDTVVTTDTHRLIRLAGTLHGKTGLKKIEFPLSKIEEFDPFKSAVVFKKGTATVLVSDAPEFKLGEETFGPYKKQRVKLPTAAAVLLVCRDRAEVVE